MTTASDFGRRDNNPADFFFAQNVLILEKRAYLFANPCVSTQNTVQNQFPACLAGEEDVETHKKSSVLKSHFVSKKLPKEN